MADALMRVNLTIIHGRIRGTISLLPCKSSFLFLLAVYADVWILQEVGELKELELHNPFSFSTAAQNSPAP